MFESVQGLGATATVSTPSNDVPFDGGQPYTPPPAPASEASGESDEGMDYFQKLAESA